MTKDTSPQPAVDAIRAQTAALYRHGPNGLREYLSLATRLETGIWAAVKDRGVFPGTVYGEFCGTEVVVDLFIHTLGALGDRVELPVKWATHTAMHPICLLGVPGDDGAGANIAPTAETTWPEYQRVHRPKLPTGERFGQWVKREDMVIEDEIHAEQGSIFGQPMVQTYRNGADDNYRQNAVCVIADMGYPADIHLGGPVVDDFGRLVGVIIGADLGSEYSHTGAFVPADHLTVAIAIAKAAIASKERFRSGIERVQHRSNQVDWPETEEDAPPARNTRHPDELVKALLPRRTWRNLLALADAGRAASDAEDGDGASVDTLRGMVGD